MERFWRQVEKTDGCWLWLGSKSARGYGKITIAGRTLSTHRLSWVFAHGEIPAGLYVLHHCDNPPCVRPDHLFLGTAADNAADAVAKGRWTTGSRNGAVLHPETRPRGERHPMARLTEDQVLQMRAKRDEGYTYQRLVEEFGVSKSTVANVVTRKKWRHLRPGEAVAGPRSSA